MSSLDQISNVLSSSWEFRSQKDLVIEILCTYPEHKKLHYIANNEHVSENLQNFMQAKIT